MLQNDLFGTVRWPWVSELYEYCQGVFLSKAIVSVVMNPRKPTVNVTAKGLTLDNDHLSELAWPFFVVYALLLSGTVVAAYRYAFEPGISNLMLIVGLWNTFSLIMAGVALGAVSERKQPDRHPRLTIDREGTLEVEGARIHVKIVNVSAGGCALRLVDEMPSMMLQADTTKARLYVEPIGDLVGDRSLPLVFRRLPPYSDGVYGCEFELMQPEEYYVLADLMYGDSDALPKFLASRRNHKSVWAGTGQFILWGLIEPVRAFAYLFKRKPKELSPEAAAPAPPEVSTDWLHRLAAEAAKAEGKAAEPAGAPAEPAAAPAEPAVASAKSA
jgi:cellulose synthase (UDP-forming)